MAAKKVTKSGFIRQRPELDIDQLIAEAAKAGLELQRDTVHKIRSIDRIKAGQTKRKGGRPKGKPTTAKRNGSIKEFILSQPRDMPVKNLIEEAKKRGLKPPHAVYVSTVRMANDRKNGSKKKGRKPGKALVTTQLRIEQGGQAADPIEIKLLEDAVAIAVKIGLRRMTQHFAQFASNI